MLCGASIFDDECDDNAACDVGGSLADPPRLLRMTLGDETVFYHWDACDGCYVTEEPRDGWPTRIDVAQWC